MVSPLAILVNCFTPIMIRLFGSLFIFINELLSSEEEFLMVRLVVLGLYELIFCPVEVEPA